MRPAATNIWLRVALCLALTGCAGEGVAVERVNLTAEIVYQESATSGEPVLLFARDLLLFRDRLYVLDGKLAHVVIFDPRNGSVISTFGGMGEGPGELGRFPYAIVSDGVRVGVAHLFTVSWFTPGGDFLTRESLPPLDLSTPSLQSSSGGWLSNAPYRGPGSPCATYISSSGDTVAFGRAAAPGGSDEAGLAAMELNAVHVGRYGNGNVIAGYVQENRIIMFGPEGTQITEYAWSTAPGNPDRGPDGRLRGYPGYTLSLTMVNDGHASLLDGSLRRVRRYDQSGILVSECDLDLPVIKALWTESGTVWAVDGTDRVLRFRVGEENSRHSSAADNPEEGPPVELSPLPGRLVERIGDLAGFLRDHGLEPKRGMSTGNPGLIRPVIAGGTTRLFLGYPDGAGVMLAPDESRVDSEWAGFRVEGRTNAHPRGSFRSRIMMAGDDPVVFEPREGLYPLHDEGPGFQWPEEFWVSDIAWLGGQRWLLHDTLSRNADPLQVIDLADGTISPAGGAGSHRAMGLTFKPAWNWWWMHRVSGERVIMFNESALSVATWSGEGDLEWHDLARSGLRTVDQRKQGGSIDREIAAVSVLDREGILLLSNDLSVEEPSNRLILVSFDGKVLRRWNLPVQLTVTGMVCSPWGGLYLSTRRALLEWMGWEEATIVH
ncbi:hypothetical protein ACFL6T_04650 [Candidatus Zixiibacteriota bacterium]